MLNNLKTLNQILKQAEQIKEFQTTNGQIDRVDTLIAYLKGVISSIPAEPEVK